MSSRVIKAKKLYSGMPRLVSIAGSSVKVLVRDGTSGEAAVTSNMESALDETARRSALEAVPGLAGPASMAETARLREDAAAQAEEIVARAQEEAAAIENAAYQEGLARGREEGRLAAQQESKRLIDEAVKILDGARAERDDIIREAKPEIIRMAMAVAGRIVREAAETDPEMAVRSAIEAIRKVRDEEELSVRANPRDAVALEERKQELRAAAPDVKKLTIAEDPTIEPGGCVIESPRGSVDARLGRQLARAEKALRDVMNGEK